MDLTSPSSFSGTQWKLGKFFGNTVYVRPMFLILIAVISLSGIQSYNGLISGLILIPLLTFSVIFHELGHAITTRYFGYGKSTIVLHGFGGVSINESRIPRDPLKSSVISGAGPISSAILAGIGYLLFILVIPQLSPSSWTSILANTIYSFYTLNLVFAIFNALPILPLDGGNVTMHLLQHSLNNPVKALRYAAYVSIATLLLALIPLFTFFSASFLTLFIIGLLVYQNFNIIRSL